MAGTDPVEPAAIVGALPTRASSTASRSMRKAALLRADSALFGKKPRIAGADVVQEIEDVALMVGHLAAEQLGKAVERDVLDVE